MQRKLFLIPILLFFFLSSCKHELSSPSPIKQTSRDTTKLRLSTVRSNPEAFGFRKVDQSELEASGLIRIKNEVDKKTFFTRLLAENDVYMNSGLNAIYMKKKNMKSVNRGLRTSTASQFYIIQSAMCLCTNTVETSSGGLISDSCPNGDNWGGIQQWIWDDLIGYDANGFSSNDIWFLGFSYGEFSVAADPSDPDRQQRFKESVDEIAEGWLQPWFW